MMDIEDEHFGDHEHHHENQGERRPVTSVIFHNFEHALQIVGAFGPYQVGFVCSVQLALFVWCGNYVFMPYATFQGRLTCETETNYSVLYDSENQEPFCSLYNNGSCTLHWETPFYTIIQEWSLFCDLDYVPQTINSVQNIGTMLSVSVAGILADVLGRKSIFYASFTVLIVTAIGDVFATHWMALAACRFVVGGASAASAIVNFVWGMEITDQKHSVIVNSTYLWHFAYMLTALVGYLTADWKTYLLVINFLGAPLLLVYGFYWESPRWLIQQGQLERAAKLMTKIAAQNRPLHRVQISADNLRGIFSTEDDDASLSKSKPRHQYGFFSLFGSKRIASYTCVMIGVYIATASAANVFIFQVTKFSGSPFLKFFLYGVLRMWIPPTLLYMDRKFGWFGRKQMLGIPMLIVCLCYFCATIGKWIGSATAVVGGTMLGAVICNCLWVALSQFTVELYPTVIRTTATGFFTVIDAITGVVVPQLIFLEKFWPVLPFLVVTVAAFTSNLMAAIILPETKGQPLPETIEDLNKEELLGGRNQGSLSTNWKKLKNEANCCSEEEDLLIENLELPDDEHDQAALHPL